MTDDDVFSRRLTAIAGLLLAVFFLVGLLLPGTPPKADDSVQKITAFLTDKRSELLAGNFSLGLGGAAFLVFAGGLRRYLAAAGRDAGGLAAAAFAGAVAGVSLLLAGAAVLNGIAFEAAPAGGDLVRAFFDTAGSLFAMAGFALFVFFVARRGQPPGPARSRSGPPGSAPLRVSSSCWAGSRCSPSPGSSPPGGQSRISP